MSQTPYRISILMPTYNDADTIVEAVDSAVAQKYENWELIIVNDGSSDETDNLIKDYLKNHDLNHKITYLQQENQDQLRALLNGASQITGDVIMFLHSDDKLLDDQSLQKIARDFQGDAILYNLQLADRDMNPTKIAKVSKIKPADQTFSSMLLFLGRNIYFDTFVASRQYFETWLKKSYLTWNIPFFMKLDSNSLELANITAIDDQIMAYRLHSANYNQTQLGKLNVLNGELRTASLLMRHYHLPFYRAQFYLSRVLNKLGFSYNPFFKKRPQKHPEKVIRFILNKTFPDGAWQNNQYLKALDSFYQKQAVSNQTLEVVIPSEEKIYLGCDMRKFNKDILENKLSNFYKMMLSEMKKGFSAVKCNDERIEDVLMFLSINPEVVKDDK